MSLELSAIPFIHLHLACSLLLIATLVFSQCLANGNTPTRASEKITEQLSVDYSNGLLNLSAINVSTVSVLERIAESVGFELIVIGQPKDSKSDWNLRRIRPEDAVKKITRDSNVIIKYRSSVDDKGSSLLRIYLLGAWVAHQHPQRGELQPGTDTFGLDDSTQQQLMQVTRLTGLNDALAIEQLTQVLRQDTDSHVKHQVIFQLQEIGGQVAVDALETGLGDGDPEVRIMLIQALSTLPDQRVSFWLGQYLLGDDNQSVRLSALNALVGLEDDNAAIFINAVADDPVERIRATAQAYLVNRQE